jgi:integrase
MAAAERTTVANHYENTANLPDGTAVGYSLVRRRGRWRVRFIGPDGRRVERGTGHKKKGDALGDAGDIILAEFRPTLPPEPEKSNWDAALRDLVNTPDLRPDSIRAYRAAVRAVRKVFPDLGGPADVTPPMAHRFKREFLSGTYARGKASDAARYKRSPTSCTTYLRVLRSLWRKHFKPLGHVTDNPWLDVPYPNAPKGKRVRVPDEYVITAFFRWLEQKHPGWELPRVFVKLKMLAGCRTLDLCQAMTANLGPDSLTLPAGATKTRTDRRVPLTADLVADLRRLAGPRWLWERALEESKVYRPNPRTKSMTAFDPSTWRWTIQNLFREFNRGRAAEARLRPHDLRARAITIVVTATGSVDATAQAMGVDPQTARHYLDAKKAYDQEVIMRDATPLLLPKAPGTGEVA